MVAMAITSFVVTVLIIGIYAIMKVSGRCSREEERREAEAFVREFHKGGE